MMIFCVIIILGVIGFVICIFDPMLCFIGVKILITWYLIVFNFCDRMGRVFEESSGRVGYQDPVRACSLALLNSVQNFGFFEVITWSSLSYL